METKTVKIPNVLRAKVAVVGDPQVGKTALCQQLSSDGTNFPKNYLMTLCMDVHVKSVNIPDTNDVVELYLADCSGRDIYKQMLEDKCWSDAAMVVAVFDVCKEESLKAASKWFEQVSKKVSASKGKDGSGEQRAQLPGVLLANKSDLKERRTVSPKAGSELAQQLGLTYFECTCKDYAGVEEPFYFLANEFHKIHEDSAEQMANMA